MAKQDLCLMLSYLSPAPQALPQAAGFSDAPHAAGLSDAPQALPAVFSFHPAMFDNAMIRTSYLICFVSAGTIACL